MIILLINKKLFKFSLKIYFLRLSILSAVHVVLTTAKVCPILTWNSAVSTLQLAVRSVHTSGKKIFGYLRVCSRYGPVVVYRVGRGKALPFHDHGTRSGWVVSNTPRPTLPPGKTRYPLHRTLGGPQGRSWRMRKISPHRDSITGPSSP